MSWFTDIAGKAEQMLNAMDKSAAQVLHTSASGSQTSSPAGSTSGGHRRHDYYTTDGHNVNAEDMSETYSLSTHSIKTISSSGSLSTTTGNGNGGQSSSRGHTRTSSFESIGSRESSKSSKASNERPLDDETLFEFLNNKGEDIPEESSVSAATSTAPTVGSKGSSESSVRASPSTHEDFEGRIKSLTTEISSLNRRNIELETDCKRLQKRVANWVNQLSASDNTIRELQSRESDLTANLDAKDSQIAVLKVRLQETDAELQQRLTQIDTLEQLNESLRTSAEANTSTTNDTVEDYRQQIRQLEGDLQMEREALKATQSQTMAQIGRLEDNQKSLVDEISILQRNIAVEKSANQELEVRLKNALKMSEDVDRDYNEFKVKANKTLADKDELIRALKSTGDPDGTGEADDAVKRVLQSQCDAMVLEIQELREKYESVRRQLDRVNNEDVVALTTRVHSLEEQLAGEQQVRQDVELELRQSRDESRYFQEDLHQTRQSLESRIGDRDVEIEKLRKQVVSKRSGNAEEYEQRFRNLTENLIQKQTIVESLTSEKHSLSLQLERSEQRLRDALANSQKSAEVSIGIHHSPSFTNLVNRSSVRPLVEDYPEDGNVTRRVKRAYGQIDAFSIRLGNFLRAYPSARAAALVYVFILHIWVAFVLIYYEPEQHGPNFKMPDMSTD